MRLGETFGRYEIVDLLQRGGMGEVYRGRDTETGDDVALKVLAPEYEGNAYVTGRFLAEAEVYRRLSHPNIVKYVDSGRIGDLNYIALEHIEGIDLAQMIHRDGPPDMDLALSIMLDVTYAVNFAHHKEIIHRDLKPQNIMITRDGVIKLIDFGVAHARNDYVNTDAGMVLGSLCYNSPEQNQGKLVDFRGDVYSLGLVFYEIVTGRRLLPNTSVSDIILSQVELDHTIVRPRFLNDQCPEALQDVILKMTRFDPRERFQNLEQVLLELKKILEDRTGVVSADAARAKALADRDLADTHYWKGMNFLAEGQYLLALGEFEALLNLSLYHHQAYITRVEEQVNFLSWTLDLCCEGAVTEDEEFKGVELDVLKQLSQVYSQNPNDGIRKAMRSLLAVYKDKVHEIHEKRRKKAKDLKMPVAPHQYPEVVRKLAGLYAKLGRTEQRRLMESKILSFARTMEDAGEARRILEQLRRDCPDDAQVRRGFVDFLFAKGPREAALAEALTLGRDFRLREDYSKALGLYKQVQEADPGNAEAAAAIDELHEALAELSKETERLVDLTQKMVQVEDYQAAINMCLKFLNDYPENLPIQDKLADLYVATGKVDRARDQLLRMGQSTHDKGDFVGARELFARALRLWPDCQEAITYLVDLFKREDPQVFEGKSSSKAIVEEIYVRLGMYDKVVADLRSRLKGSGADLRLHDRIIEMLDTACDHDAMLEARVDKMVCAFTAGAIDCARDEIDAFLADHPDETARLERLKNLPFEVKLRVNDSRIREMLG